MAGVDWSRVGPTLCETEGCDHHITLVFTQMHPWDLYCARGLWWRGCLDAAKVRHAPIGSPRPPRCECPGCQPRAEVRLNLRVPKRCRCDPARIAAEAAARAEEGSVSGDVSR